MFYRIIYGSGEVREGELKDLKSAIDYADSRNSGYSYTVNEYESYEEYLAEEKD